MSENISQLHAAAPAALYLAGRLDEAYEFMMRVMKYPVTECGEPLVSLESVTAESGVHVEFSRKPHVLGMPRLYLLRQSQIRGFLQAAAEMNRRDWIMRVEDGYRNRIMQKFIGRQPAIFDAILRVVIRELGGQIPSQEFMFKRVLTLTAQIPKTATHMSGSAIDISVLDKSTGLEVDRGAPYLEFSELTPMDSPFINNSAKKNRQEITGIMRSAGFIEYPYEFWHYNSGDAYESVLCGRSSPAIYGAVDWNPDTGHTTPIPNPDRSLNDLDEIKAEIDASILRIKATDGER
jgi:D-alanyl-D-alanine dipeptidase